MKLLDIILVACLLLVAWFGYRRGFLASLLGIASGALSLFLVSQLAPPLAGPLARTRPFLTLAARVEGTLSGLLTAGSQELEGGLQALGLPREWGEALTGGASQTVTDATQQLVSGVATAAAAFLIYMLLQLALWRLLRRVAVGVNRVPLLGGVNRLLGLLLGLVWGLFLVLMLIAAIRALSPFWPGLAEQAGQSAIVHLVAERQLLEWLTGSI